MHTDVASPPEVTPILPRIGEVLREIARGGLAGILAGIVVGGIGGRIAMRIVALISPESAGLRTENGNLIGAVTASGTLALILFGGLFMGAIAGILWVVVSPWMPGSGRRRWILAAVVAVALGGFIVVRSDNIDFSLVDPDAPIIALLLGLIALFGAAVAWLDELLERKLPRPGGNAAGLVIAYGVVTLLGLLFVPIAVGFYTSTRTCGCASPPERTGWALFVVGIVTAVWWVIRIATGRSERPPALQAAGRIGLVAAVLLGLAYLIPDVAKILSPA